MRPERFNSPGQESCEQQQDLQWIDENREILWLTATVAFVEIGYGFIVVDLTQEAENQGHPFGYYSEGELELEREVMRQMLGAYDPDREFILLLAKEGGRSDIYLGRRPEMGWYTDMRTQTPYQKLGSET